MNVVYLILVILGVSAQDILKKIKTAKGGDGGVYLFAAFISMAAAVFFAVISGGLQWNWGFLPYSAGFALAYGMCTMCGVLAIANGPLSITTLVVSYSLMLPTLYGLLFLGDPITPGLIFGIVLLVISLFLVTKKNKEAPLTLKWGIYALLTFIGNGMCSVVQKMQQDVFDGAYKNEFMIVAYVLAAVAFVILALCKERKTMAHTAKTAWHLAILCGAMNGMVNLFILILQGRMPLSVMFPLVSAGGIVVTYLISKFVYKEKLTALQFVGFLLGIASVVLLNI